MRKVLHAVILGGCSLAAIGTNPAMAQLPFMNTPRGGMGAGYGQASSNATVPLAWIENVDAALQQAAAQRRLVLVHFWSDNCPPCVGVERNVLSRPEVQQAIQANFIPVKIKVDNQPAVAERFRVDRWPTDLILLPDGQELVRSVSSQDPARYTAFLARAASALNAANSAAQQASNTAAAATQDFANNAARQMNNAAYQVNNASNQFASQLASHAANAANPYAPPSNPGAPTVGPGGYGVPANPPAGPASDSGGRFLPQGASNPSDFNRQGGSFAAAPDSGFAASPPTQNAPYPGNPSRFSPPSPPPVANGFQGYGQTDASQGAPSPGYVPPSNNSFGGFGQNNAPQANASPNGQSPFGAPASGGSLAGGNPSGGGPGAGNAGLGSPFGGSGEQRFAPDGVSQQAAFRSNRGAITPAAMSAPAGGGGPPVGGGGAVGAGGGGVGGGGGGGVGVGVVGGGAAAPAGNAMPQPSAVGLDGFCPVTLFETRKWRRADARWGVVHRDRTYLFAGPDQQKRFLEDPDRYAPMLSGYDPVRYLEQGQLVEGRRQHGLWYRNQMFLFADEMSLEQFWKNAEAFAPRVEQAMQRPVTGGPIRR